MESSINTSYSVPTYIIDRSPKKYGGRQEDFLRRSSAIVEEGVERVTKAHKGEESLKQLYLSLFHEFRGQRQQIAQDHGTPKAEFFGRMRNHPKVPTLYHTILDHEYAEYGMKIKVILKGFLDQMRGTSKRTFEFPTDPNFPRYSCIEVEVLEQKDLMERGWLSPPTLEEINLPDLEYNALGQLSHESLARVKKERKPMYQRLGMFQKFVLLQSEFPSPKVVGQNEHGVVFDYPEREKNLKSLFVRAVVKQEVEGKVYHVYEYLTWMYRDHRTDPHERMVRDSTPILFHLDGLNIDDPAMGDLASLFAKAVLSDEKLLKYKVCEYRKFQAFVMPICRGNASTTEWYEQLLFKIHHLQLNFKKGVHPDLEGFATPSASEYHENYVKGKFMTWE